MDYPRFSTLAEFGPDLQFRYRHILGANDIFNPHCHEYYEIFITISGTVTHWINGITKSLPEGSLVLIRPDDIHGYIYEAPESAETVYVNLSFHKDLMGDLCTYLSDAFPSKSLLETPLPPTVILNKIEKNKLLALIEELNTVTWKNTAAMNLRIRIVLAEIFSRGFSGFSSAPEEEHTQEPLWLSQLISEMQQPENFTAGSEQMFLLSKHSREHVCRTLQKYRGVTVSEFLNDLRINYASNLLIHSNAPVMDICYACGFQSVSNFYKAFTRAYQLSPSQFRRKYK